MALTDKLTNIADAIREKTGSTDTMNLEGMAAAVTNIKIPTALSDLNEDETHRTVTDAEKKTWNDKSDFSGNYDDLKNKPTIPTIPDGGSSQWKIIRDLTISENADRVDINKDNDGNTFALHEIHVFSYTKSYADASEAYTFLLNGFWNAYDPYFNSGFKSTASSSNYYAENHFIATMQNGFANIFQPWKAGIIGTKPGGDVYSFGDRYQTIESVSFVGKFIAGCRFILVGRVTL